VAHPLAQRSSTPVDAPRSCRTSGRTPLRAEHRSDATRSPTESARTLVGILDGAEPLDAPTDDLRRYVADLRRHRSPAIAAVRHRVTAARSTAGPSATGPRRSRTCASCSKLPRTGVPPAAGYRAHPPHARTWRHAPRPNKGWVQRSPDPSDGRYTLAMLTDPGWAKVVAAAPGHVREVRRLVLTRAQVRQLAGIGARIAAALSPNAGSGCARHPRGHHLLLTTVAV
jgi:hypothetical protein